MPDPGAMTDDGLSIDGPETLRGSLIVVVLSLGLVAYGGYDYVESREAVRDAVTVEATITDRGVETTSSRTGSGSDVEYEPTVAFTYEYEGERHTGTAVYPGRVDTSYDTEAGAREVVAPYEPGTTVTAYVDPADPDAAFLRDRVSNDQFLLVGIGAVLALFGAYSAVRNRRRGA